MVTDATVTTQKDAPSAKDAPSGGGTPKPSEVTGQVSTEDPLVQLQKFAEDFANKKHSKLDTRLHGYETENTSLKQQLAELSGKLSEVSEANLEKEEQAAIAAATAEGDTEKAKAVKSSYQLKRENAAAKATLEETNRQIEANKDLIERFNIQRQETKAAELETDTGVSKELILEQFKLFNLTEIEDMVKLAESLKGKVVKAGEPPAPLPHPDALTTTGGSEKSYEQGLKERYPTMK